jgi:ribosomal-protein-serine acetyltransferase
MNPLLLDIPHELTTDRLLLRAPRHGDGVMIYNTTRASLPELKKWMIWATDNFNLEDAEEWCRGSAAKFLSREQFSFLIFSKKSVHLGNVTAMKFDWAIPRCEIGYWLATAHCGHGFMTEAVNAVTKLAFDLLKCHRVEIRAVGWFFSGRHDAP